MSLISENILKSVVSIGFKDQESKQSSWIGTGFLYGDYVKSVDDKTNQYMVYLVTNKHVINVLNNEAKHEGFVKMNPIGLDTAKEFKLKVADKDSNHLWLEHDDPEIDLALVQVNIRLLNENKIEYSFFTSDQDVLDINQMKIENITEGDDIVLLGYPLNLVGIERNYVIARGGIIARIQDTLAGREKTFLVDAQNFPGNSGGPVILKPTSLCLKGTRPHLRPMLIGVVKSYIPYQEVALSTQSGRARMIFEENSGLAIAETTNSIKEVLRKSKSPSS